MTETSDLLARAQTCSQIAIKVGYTRDGGHVVYLADELNNLPDGNWPKTQEARRALRDAIACAVRSGPVAQRQVWSAEEIDAAVDLVAEYAKVDRTQYLVMPLPGWYQSHDLVHPVRGGVHDNAEDAFRKARRKPGSWGVIKVDGRLQAPPWRGHDLDRLYRDNHVPQPGEKPRPDRVPVSRCR
jgi:hypothetical protein